MKTSSLHRAEYNLLIDLSGFTGLKTDYFFKEATFLIKKSSHFKKKQHPCLSTNYHNPLDAHSCALSHLEHYLFIYICE